MGFMPYALQDWALQRSGAVTVLLSSINTHAFVVVGFFMYLLHEPNRWRGRKT